MNPMKYKFCFDKVLLKNFNDGIKDWCNKHMPVYGALTFKEDWGYVLQHIDSIPEGEDYPVYTYHKNLWWKYVIYRNVLDETDWLVVHIDFADTHHTAVIVKLQVPADLPEEKVLDESQWWIHEVGVIEPSLELIRISLQGEARRLWDA